MRFRVVPKSTTFDDPEGPARRSASHRLSTYGGRAFCYAGPSAWNALPDLKNNTLSLSIPLDASLNISTSHVTSTLSAFEVILQLTRYINYLLTYLLTYWTHVSRYTPRIAQHA